jgi:hypothetical protein
MRGGMCEWDSYDDAAQFEKELERRAAEGLCWAAEVETACYGHCMVSVELHRVAVSGCNGLDSV